MGGHESFARLNKEPMFSWRQVFVNNDMMVHLIQSCLVLALYLIGRHKGFSFTTYII